MDKVLFTIGFTGKTAEQFFTLLKKAGVRKIIDVRLYPSTQLSGFSKSKDLAYFLKSIGNIDYEHRTDFAPSADILRDYKDGKIGWTEYEQRYMDLIKSRMVLSSADELNHACLLCAEQTAEKCHRRLLAEYLAEQLKMQVKHLI